MGVTSISTGGARPSQKAARSSPSVMGRLQTQFPARGALSLSGFLFSGNIGTPSSDRNGYWLVGCPSQVATATARCGSSTPLCGRTGVFIGIEPRVVRRPVHAAYRQLVMVHDSDAI